MIFFGIIFLFLLILLNSFGYQGLVFSFQFFRLWVILCHALVFWARIYLFIILIVILIIFIILMLIFIFTCLAFIVKTEVFHHLKKLLDDDGPVELRLSEHTKQILDLLIS